MQALASLRKQLGEKRIQPSVVVNEFRFPETVHLASLAVLSGGEKPPRLRYRVAQATAAPYGEWSAYSRAESVPIERPGAVVQYQIEHPVLAAPTTVQAVQIQWFQEETEAGSSHKSVSPSQRVSLFHRQQELDSSLSMERERSGRKSLRSR